MVGVHAYSDCAEIMRALAGTNYGEERRYASVKKEKYSGPPDDVDGLHVERNHLVGCFYIGIIDATTVIWICIMRKSFFATTIAIRFRGFAS
jgi:hypothetical protein